MDSKKGQYFSFDAIIASVIFILAITSLLSYWNGTRNTFNLQNSDITKEAFRISDLIFTPGYPLPTPPDAYVSCAGQTQLGFAVSWNDQRLDSRKIDSCLQLTVDQINQLNQKLRTRFGVSIYVNNVRKAGRQVISPPINSPNIVVVHRVATVHEQNPVPEGHDYIANVDVYLYE